MKAILLAILASAAIVSVEASITAQTCSNSGCSDGCQVGTFETGVCTSANNGAYMLGSCDGGVASVGLFTSADCSGSPLFTIGDSCGLLFSGTYASATCNDEGVPARKTVRL